MAVFEIAAKFTLTSEGGYADSKTDLGGETNFGISKRAYPDVDIKALTREKALVIYKRDYWDKYRISEINDQYVANQVFDMVFNMNASKAVACVQRAVRTLYKIDGIIGSETIRAINSCNPVFLLDSIRVERMRHYLRRITENKTQLVNMPSWTRRSLENYT